MLNRGIFPRSFSYADTHVVMRSPKTPLNPFYFLPDLQDPTAKSTSNRLLKAMRGS